MQMSVYYIEPFLKAVFFEILSESHHISLIHTYMYAPRTQTGCKGGKHTVDQLVSSFIINKQNIVIIPNFFVFIAPLKNGVEMCKGLYAGH